MMLTTWTAPTSAVLAGYRRGGSDRLTVFGMQEHEPSELRGLAVGLVENPERLLRGLRLRRAGPHHVPAVRVENLEPSGLEGSADDAPHIDRRRPPEWIVLRVARRRRLGEADDGADHDRSRAVRVLTHGVVGDLL